MATLHVRNVPDELYELLRERAAANDRSIGAETVQLLQDGLALAGQPTRRLPIPGLRRRPSAGTGLFTRFTVEARQAVVSAQEEARGLGHDHVGTEHLLLGVLDQDDRVVRALEAKGLTAAGVRAQLELGDAHPSGQIPFEPQTKQALELALRESTRHGDQVIALEHMVLGIAGATASRGAAILRVAEPDEGRLRRSLLTDPGAARFRMSPLSAPMGEASFRVILLDGEADNWEKQLNDVAALGYELVEIVDRRAIFRR